MVRFVQLENRSMEPLQQLRDVASLAGPAHHTTGDGRMCIAVIGIDRYRTWSPLRNAVSDARGALNLFLDLGFEPACAPLYDEAATADALHRLVTDDLAALGPQDSLVLFFAGHGHTVVRTYPGATSVTKKEGYIIPVDGDRPGGRISTWLRLDTWLSDVAHAPVRHLLVVLDACHSGIALDPVIWRSSDVDSTGAIEPLRARRSRRVITSALDDQRAMDSGPVPGHSLFTGCLIEALTGGLAASAGESLVTGTDIGRYVQRRVSSYPDSSQTPDFGALELDDRGELFVRVRPIDVLQLAGTSDAAPARLDAQPASEAPGDPGLDPRPARDGATAHALRLIVLVGAIGLLIGELASVGSRTLGVSPVNGRDAGPSDTSISTPDAAVPEALVPDAAIPDATAPVASPPLPPDAAPSHRDGWLDGPIFGADNSSAAIGPARISATHGGYTVWIEKDLGFSCSLELDDAGDPKALLHCAARSPIWSATPARIPMRCVPDARKRRVRCSGRYTLHEDSDHASSAEIQLDRELRLNEIVR
jgi:uncharacterized caspase-like protein